MDAANKPGRGPVQPGWTSTDLRPDQPAPISAPVPDHLGQEDRARIRVNGGSRPPFLVDAAHPPTRSERSRRPRSLDADEPPRTLALASSRRIRDVRGEAAAYEGDEAAAGGAIGGRTMNPRDRPLWYEGRGRYRRAAGPRWAAGWFGTAGPPPAAPTQ